MLSLEEKRNLNLNFSFSRTFFLFVLPFYHSRHFITIQPFGETKKPLTLTEGRLGLTHKRLNCPPTGTHPSPRSASVWGSTNRSGLLSSTSRRIPCTLWSLMGNTATPRWVVTRGSHWLVLRPPCSSTVTRKDLMLLVTIILVIPKQESVSLVTNKMIAPLATLELDLAPEDILIITTHVVTRLQPLQIMVLSISRQWDIFWCSEKKLIWANLPPWRQTKASLT